MSNFRASGARGGRFDPIGESCYGARTLRRVRYLRAGARALGAAVVFGAPPLTLVATALVLAGGCGPARFLTQVNDKAAGAVAAAQAAHANTRAPYEFTASTEYLRKAREEGAYAEYQIAIQYGRRAEELAIRARAIAEEQGGGQSDSGAPAGAPPGSGASVGRSASGSDAEPRTPAKDSP